MELNRKLSSGGKEKKRKTMEAQVCNLKTGLCRAQI